MRFSRYHEHCGVCVCVYVAVMGGECGGGGGVVVDIGVRCLSVALMPTAHKRTTQPTTNPYPTTISQIG